MTIEEKLQHFLDSCVADATARADNMLSDYEAALKNTFDEHKKDALSRQKQELASEEDKITKDSNKQLSIEQIALRKEFAAMQVELKDKLFVEVKDKLSRFMEGSEYQKLLESQIEAAIEFAGDDDITIYLDEADEDLLRALSLKYGKDIRLSDSAILGGTKAVISSKNVLIDNSFKTKLEEAYENFSFDIGGHLHE